MRRIIFTLGVLLAALWLGGCEKPDGEKQEMPGIARLEIYGADGTTLTGVVEDKEKLLRFEEGGWGQEEGISPDVDQTGQDLEGKEPLFTITALKAPAALIGSMEIERMFSITVYEDTDVVKMTVLPGSIKNMSLPEELLTFYFRVPDEDMEFFLSLAGD